MFWNILATQNIPTIFRKVCTGYRKSNMENHITPCNMKKVHCVPFRQRYRVGIKSESLEDSEQRVKISGMIY